MGWFDSSPFHPAIILRQLLGNQRAAAVGGGDHLWHLLRKSSRAAALCCCCSQSVQRHLKSSFKEKVAAASALGGNLDVRSAALRSAHLHLPSTVLSSLWKDVSTRMTAVASKQVDSVLDALDFVRYFGTLYGWEDVEWSSKSKEPQLVYVRFENRTDHPVSILWPDHQGTETVFHNLEPGASVSQESYVDNTWMVRHRASNVAVQQFMISDLPRQLCIIEASNKSHHSSGGAIQDATDGAVSIEMPLVMSAPVADISIPSCYTQRMETKWGVPVVAHPQVSLVALREAADIINHMLEGCPGFVLRRLRQHHCRVALIARDQVTTDILEHSHLRGTTAGDGRSWDDQVRGLGGTLVIPTCSVGEENVLRCPKDRYGQESILIHEFAHTVMEVAFTKKLHKRINDCFSSSKKLYTEGIYMVVDEKEYWAEGSESWFDASKRDDVNDGINTRAKITSHDPQLAIILKQIYGNGPWRYDFCPRE